MNIEFIPIPLATGDEVVVPETGESMQVQSIAVTVSLADGTSVVRDLAKRGTGWWYPER